MAQDNQMTLKEQGSIFGFLASSSPMPIEERGVKGARRFKKQFGGILNLNKRSEPETVQFLEDIGMASNPTEAKKLMQALLEKTVVYRGNIKHCEGGFYDRPAQAYFFKLQELECPKGKMYRLYTWDNMPDAS